MSLPIACSLTNSDLQERRRNVLQKVRSAVSEMRELEDGYAHCFPSDENWLAELATLVNLNVNVVPSSSLGSRWNQATVPLVRNDSPEGTKEFLAAIFT